MNIAELVVAHNICNYFWKYRGIDGDVDQPEERLIQDLSAYGFIRLNGTYKEGGRIEVFIISSEHSYTTSKDNIHKFISKVKIHENDL